MTSLIVPDPPEVPSGPIPVGDPAASAIIADTAPIVEETSMTEGIPIEDLPESWQKEISDLRRENANRRTALSSYEQAFDGYDDETRDAFLEYARVVRAAQNGDPDAIATLQEWTGEDDDDVDPEPQIDPVEAARQAAREETERIFSERETARMRSDAISSVQNTAKEWGFEPTPGQPGHARYKRLVDIAANELPPDTTNPLEEARKVLEGEEAAFRQAAIDEYLGKKGEQADRSPQFAPPNGAAPGVDPMAYLHDPTLTEAQKFQITRERAAERFRQNA